MNSYASVANVLSGLWPDGDAALEPGSTLLIEDNFSGRKATVVAAAVPDVAAVIKGLVTKPGKYVPEDGKASAAPAKQEAKAATAETAAAPVKKKKDRREETRKRTEKRRAARAAAKLAAASESAKAEPSTPQAKESAAPEKTPAPAKKTPPAAKKAATPASKAKAAGKGKGATAAKSGNQKPRPAGIPKMPRWLESAHKDREDTDDGEGGKIELSRTAIGLGKKGFKEVLGPAKGDEPDVAWGYDVRSGGEHVAWLIAKPQQGFVIAGVEAFEYRPSEHKMLGGAVARLQAMIIPKHKASRGAKAA